MQTGFEGEDASLEQVRRAETDRALNDLSRGLARVLEANLLTPLERYERALTILAGVDGEGLAKVMALVARDALGDDAS